MNVNLSSTHKIRDEHGTYTVHKDIGVDRRPSVYKMHREFSVNGAFGVHAQPIQDHRSSV